MKAVAHQYRRGRRGREKGLLTQTSPATVEQSRAVRDASSIGMLSKHSLARDITRYLLTSTAAHAHSFATSRLIFVDSLRERDETSRASLIVVLTDTHTQWKVPVKGLPSLTENRSEKKTMREDERLRAGVCVADAASETEMKDALPE